MAQQPQYAGYPPPPGAGQMPMTGYPPVGGAPPQAQDGWMAKPQVPSGCPPGLEYLTMIDQLLIHQTVELLEAVTNIETKNKYAIKNSVGQQVYYAAEESGFLTRQCCGSQRGFTMHIADNFGQEVMQIRRDFKLCAGCCWCACIDCCSHEVVIEAPVGTPVGYVKQTCSFWKAEYEILDSNHDTILTIVGPCCLCECPCFDLEFTLFGSNGDEIGAVSKQWSGLVKEMFTDAENFGIRFPMDLDVKVKATLLGAAFLIDFMFFEKSGKDN